MKDANGNWIGLGLGDIDPQVAVAKGKMRKKFSYAKGLDDSPLFDAALQAAVTTAQHNWGLTVTGTLNWATQVKLGMVSAAPVVKPLYFSVEGHMSDMWAGPVADTGTALANEGRVHHQPIGYNNGALPFDNASGTNELARMFGQGTLDSGVAFPLGTKFVLGGFSQGAIVVTDFIVNYLQPGQVHAPRAADCLGVLMYGNPCRSKGSVAPWSVAQAGPAANAGIDPLIRLDKLGIKLPYPLMDVYRKGDIFSDNEPNTGAPAPAPLPTSTTDPLSLLTQLGGLLSPTGSLEGNVKSAVYQAVARTDFFSNPYSLLAQIADIFTTPLAEVWGIFQAIVSGIAFILPGQPNPHYSPFDISGGINWVRTLVS